MDRLWWKLPGPEVFIERVAQDLREGRNVVLCLPKFLPGGLQSALRELFRDDDDCHWQALSLSPNEAGAPLDYLYNRFAACSSIQQIFRLADLAHQPAFGGRIFWIEEIPVVHWPAWKQFLIEYDKVCRAISIFQRSIFCIALSGSAALSPPADDVTIAVHRWYGVVQALDLLIFTHRCFNSASLSPLHKRLAIAVSAELAMWDPHLPLRLADESLETILRPLPLLLDLAKERHWLEHVTEAGGESWHMGVANRFEGAERYHTAWLASRGSQKEIERRIWSAELSTMLPFVEEQRHKLLEVFAKRLRVPFSTHKGGTIENLQDLEIGHIETQLSTDGRSLAPRTRKFIANLRRIRNSLAHLKPVELEVILCRELESFDWQTS